MNLKDYIEHYAHTRCSGDMPKADVILAERWKVTARTVQSWRLLDRVPLVEVARFIVRNTKGAVTYEGIFAPYKRSRKR